MKQEKNTSQGKLKTFFNLKKAQEEEEKRRKKKEGFVNFPSRRQFYEHINKRRYERLQYMENIGLK